MSNPENNENDDKGNEKPIGIVEELALLKSMVKRFEQTQPSPPSTNNSETSNANKSTLDMGIIPKLNERLELLERHLKTNNLRLESKKILVEQKSQKVKELNVMLKEHGVFSYTKDGECENLEVGVESSPQINSISFNIIKEKSKTIVKFKFNDSLFTQTYETVNCDEILQNIDDKLHPEIIKLSISKESMDSIFECVKNFIKKNQFEFEEDCFRERNMFLVISEDKDTSFLKTLNIQREGLGKSLRTISKQIRELKAELEKSQLKCQRLIKERRKYKKKEVNESEEMKSAFNFKARALLKNFDGGFKQRDPISPTTKSNSPTTKSNSPTTKNNSPIFNEKEINDKKLNELDELEESVPPKKRKSVILLEELVKEELKNFKKEGKKEESPKNNKSDKEDEEKK